MGLLSDSLYALFDDNIISVHEWTNFKDGQIFALRVNGLLLDSHKPEGITPKEGFLSGTITRADGSKSSVHVDIKMSWTDTSYTLLIDGNEVPLIESTEAKIKEKVKSYGHDFEEYRENPTTTGTSKLPANLLEDVRAQLMKDEKKQEWGRGLVILAISLVLFVVALGVLFGDDVLFGDTPFNYLVIFLISVVGVLFIHELGHLIWMKIFGYVDLKMFFIPFFGAAVYGRKENGPRHHRAIVFLMGPIPGLLLAFAFLITPELHIFFLDIFVLMLVVINAFNLLPILPLDGGRFLEEILFCRNRFIEIGFYLIATILLILGGLAMKSYILIAMGVLVGISLPTKFKIASIASKIKKDGIDVTNVPARELKDSDLSRILEQLKPICETPKDYADGVKDIIEQSQKPPGIGVTIILLFVYILSFYLVFMLAMMAFDYTPP